MATSSNIYIDPGSTDAVPVYLVVASGVNTFLPRAALNDSSGNEITVGNPLSVVGTVVTVNQGTSPWLVSASIGGIATVAQGTTPWLSNVSVVGQPAVTATVAAPLPVTATYAAPWNVVASQGGAPWSINASVIGSPTIYQGTNPWVISGTIIIGGGANTVTITNVTLAALATVYQGTIPWTVNASVIGQAAVTASLIGTPGIVATYSGPWNVVVSQGNGTWSVNASIIGVPPVNATYAAPWQVLAQANPSTIGASIYSNISLVATCVTINVASTNLYGYHFYNSGSSVAYISLFAQTLATMGKTAATSIMAVPPGGWLDDRYTVPDEYIQGLLVGASASINGTGNPASPILANVYYK